MTLGKTPIEITEKDLLERPLGSSGAAKESGGMNPLAILKQVQGAMSEFKAIIEMARGMGLNVPGMASGKPAGTDNSNRVFDRPALNEGNPVNQAAAFLSLLEMRYGDITMNELAEKLKTDFGTVKLSELKGRQK